MTTAHELDEQARAIAESAPLVPYEPPAALPDIPGRDELTVLAQLAVTFAKAGLVPAAMRGKPADVLLVLMTGRGLGIDPMVALRECHPIDGKVTISPKLKLAIVRQRGLGRCWPDPENGSTSARWFAVRDDDPSATVYASTFTMDDAKAAGLVNKDNWKKYPARMLSWRALGYLLDEAFGEVGTGLYSADELGAVTDEDGHAVIDVTEVPPLPGMPGADPPSNANDVAPEIERDAIKARIATLPPPAVKALAEAWAAEGPDGNPFLWPLKILPNRQVRAAHALVDGIEKRAKAGEFGTWVGHTDADVPGSGPSAAATGLDGPSGGTGTPETADGHTGADPQGGDEPVEDEVCAEPGCDEPPVFYDEDAEPWCAEHRPF